MDYYEDDLLRPRLSTETASSRTAFATIVSERLLSVYELVGAEDVMNDVCVLRGIVDRLWAAVGGEGSVDQEDYDLAGTLYPAQDGDDWRFFHGYGQNACGAIRFAVQSFMTSDIENSVSAGDEMYEAADYGARNSLPSTSFTFYDAAAEELLSSQPVVRLVVETFAADLDQIQQAQDEELHHIRAVMKTSLDAWASQWPRSYSAE